MTDLLAALTELRDRVLRSEYRAVRVDRGIGSAYATIHASLDWYSQPMNRPKATDEFMTELIEGWRGRFGPEQVTKTLVILEAERGT